MSISLTGSDYTFSGIVEFGQPESETYNYILSGNNVFATIYNNNISAVTQTGSLTYENAANTQTVKLNNNQLTNTSVVFQTVGTKKFIINDNTIFSNSIEKLNSKLLLISITFEG